MTHTAHDQLDAKSLTILQAVDDGHDDTLKIRKAITLDNRQINHYLVEKLASLEDQGLVKTHRPDGPERRQVNGHTQYLPYAPKRVELTENGHTLLRETDNTETHTDLSKQELVQRVRTLEEQVDELETRFDVFRRQVKDEFSN